jgi:hypothetical protein
MAVATMTDFTAEQVDQLADALADRLLERLADVLPAQPSLNRHGTVTGALVDAQALADALGCSREFVYRHADEFGGKRVAEGPRGRLRFDPTVALERWQAQPADTTSRATPAKRRNRPASTTVQLLPIRGEQ